MVLTMTKQFSGDQVFNSGQIGTPELSKPPPSECPRCGSINTKFCYYNNYNKSQPRHFCKSCKRHWTKGGTLRNIPAGRRRRNCRPRTSTAAAAPRQEHFKYSLSLHNDQDDDMSNILYQALARSSTSPSAVDNNSIPQSTILESNGTTYIASTPQNQNTEFTFSTSANFTCIPTSNYQSSGDSIFYFAEETTATTSAAPPWTAVNPSTAADYLWNCNEIDFFDAAAYKPIFEENYYISKLMDQQIIKYDDI